MLDPGRHRPDAAHRGMRGHAKAVALGIFFVLAAALLAVRLFGGSG
jgi:hypothetical protein